MNNTFFDNVMQEYLLSTPFFYSLALTLIHFIWQGFLIALVLKSALIIITDKNPQLRYLLSALAMLLSLFLPFITFYIIYQAELLPLTDGLSALAPINFTTNQLATASNYWSAYFVEFLPYLSILWIISVILLSAKLLIEMYLVNQLPKQSVMQPDAALNRRFLALVNQINLMVTPRLLISLKTDVPMALGWLKPVILLPASMLSGLTTAQLEMLLLHELAHIRRHDYLVNFIQTLVALLLFFHPSVQWISKQMRNEREYCSDDIAVQHCGDAIAYAHTLADTAALCSKHRKHTIPSMAMAASGGDLKQRVIRLVDHHCTANNEVGKWLAAAFTIISLLLISSQQLLTPSLLEMGSNVIPQHFNVEDIKPSTNITTSLAQQLLNKEQGYVTKNAKEILVQDLTLINDNSLEETLLPRNFGIIKNQTTTGINPQIQETTPDEKMESITKIMGLQTSSKMVSQIDSLSAKDEIDDTFVQLSPSSQPILKIDSQTASTTSVLEDNQGYLNKESMLDNAFDNHNKKTPAISLAINENKSNADLAFERTDSTHMTSTMTNPYANQIALLSGEQAITRKAIINNNITSTTPADFSFNSDGNTFTVDSSSYQNQIQPSDTIFSQNRSSENIDKQKAELISSSEPKYPSSAKRKGLEIEIQVFFTIDINGLVKDIEFEQQNNVGYFRSAIKTAMRKWYFHPAEVNGKAVESKMSKIFSFNLQG